MLAWLLNCAPGGDWGPAGAAPLWLEIVKPRAGWTLSQGPGFLLGSYAAEKLEEWKYLDQMARE